MKIVRSVAAPVGLAVAENQKLARHITSILGQETITISREI